MTDELAPEKYKVILLNDGRHFAEHVIRMLRRRLPHLNYAAAHDLMMSAHRTGRSVIFEGSQTAAEELTVTLRQDGLFVDVLPKDAPLPPEVKPPALIATPIGQRVFAGLALLLVIVWLLVSSGP